MGLTRIKAGQISDIDYKQAVRVITLSNITLSGGAPSAVDGINLAANDRILVAGQDPGSQNGIYRVQTLGTGSNGTWVRTTDANENGEIEAGMIVMVTEGDTYKDTQWKLITNNPIVIDSTPLVFEQNSAFAFGNIYANGTSVLATTVGSAVTFTAGNNIAITGNNTSKSIQFDVTGISLNSISNGTSNVNVVSSGGNITVGVGGTSNIAVFSTAGLDITGRASVTGNVIGGNLLTGGLISVTGNITAGNVSATLLTGTLTTAAQPNITSVGNLSSLTVTGNITGNYILGNGSALTGINSFGTIKASGQNDIVANSVNTSVTFAAASGSGLTWSTDAANGVITIDQIATESIFATGGDMDLITQAVTSSEDLGLITDAFTVSYDLGSVVSASGLIYPSQLVLPTYTANTLPSATPAAQFVFLSNSSVGAMTAYSDGTNWRFTSTGAIVS